MKQSRSLWRLIKRAQPWRYRWAWVIAFLLIAALILYIAPDTAHDVVNHVHTETDRFGHMGMDPIGPIGTPELDLTPSKPAGSSMFGSKIMERECRTFLEQTFGVPFPTVRPDFLKRPKTKRNLELDCYNADLKLAVEYSGPQHRVYLPLQHKFDIQNFHDQLERDEWKANRCRELGIDLIVVPDTVPRADLTAFIADRLRQLGRM